MRPLASMWGLYSWPGEYRSTCMHAYVVAAACTCRCWAVDSTNTVVSVSIDTTDERHCVFDQVGTGYPTPGNASRSACGALYRGLRRCPLEQRLRADSAGWLVSSACWLVGAEQLQDGGSVARAYADDGWSTYGYPTQWRWTRGRRDDHTCISSWLTTGRPVHLDSRSSIAAIFSS